MTTLLCINPKSRAGDCIDCEPFVEKLHRLGPVVIHRLGEDDFDEVVAALGDRLERVVIGGGDGTLNRLLPEVIDLGVPLGVLPLGTGNDFARALGLPLDPEEAVDVVVEGSLRQVDLGMANGRWFLNAAGIGLGPELTRRLDGERKQRLGVLAYLSSAIEGIGDWRTRRAILEVNGTRKKTSFLQITIANGVHYGGGMTVSRDAAVDDGQLRILVIKPQTPWQLLRKFFALRWGTRKDETPEKIELLSSDHVRVRTASPCEVTIDGELATTTPLECRSVPGAIEVYAPLAQERAA